jgi:intein/homing endonuclease
MGLKYKVNEKFFDEWSHEMAYVLGFIYADGSMEDAPAIRGKYVRVTNTDKDRIELIKTLLESEHSVYVQPTIGNRKTRYLLRIGNRTLYRRLAEIGLTPHKSLTIPFPNIPKEFLGAFILGYFDGDGCAFLEKNTHGNLKRLLTIFTSSSHLFLVTLRELLQTHAGVSDKKITNHGSTLSTYQLRYSTKDSLLIFKYMYNSPTHIRLGLGRKYAIFIKYLDLRNLA